MLGLLQLLGAGTPGSACSAVLFAWLALVVRDYKQRLQANLYFGQQANL
jgi:hypothetical protein